MQNWLWVSGSEKNSEVKWEPVVQLSQDFPYLSGMVIV